MTTALEGVRGQLHATAALYDFMAGAEDNGVIALYYQLTALMRKI
jgi:hypothetical protein